MASLTLHNCFNLTTSLNISTGLDCHCIIKTIVRPGPRGQIGLGPMGKDSLRRICELILGSKDNFRLEQISDGLGKLIRIEF